MVVKQSTRRRLDPALSVVALIIQMVTAPAYAEGGVTFEVGHRSDDFYWNIADSDGNPDVLSELAWTLDEMRELRVKGDVSLGNWQLAWHGARATVEEGNNQDSDYLGNGRTLEFSRSNNKGGGAANDVGIRLGYRFSANLPAAPAFVEVIPSIGYTQMRQYLTMTDGCQTIPNPDPRTSCTPFANLQSTYDTEWEALVVGVEMSFGLRASPLSLHLRVEHFAEAEYQATANWNLRQNLQHPISFTQHAEAVGTKGSIGLEYVLSGPAVVTLTYVKLEMTTDAGTDTTFLSNGQVESTRLNEVDWTSDAILLGIGVRLY